MDGLHRENFKQLKMVRLATFNYTFRNLNLFMIHNGDCILADPVTVSIGSPSDDPIERTVGTSVTLNCTWNSTAYYVGWYKDGYLVYAMDLASSEVLNNTLSAASSYEGRYSELTIPGSELADSGNYTCVVSCEVRDMAFDDIPEALEDSKEVSFYGKSYC